MDLIATGLGAGSLVIALVALRRSFRNDERDREAIISAETVWAGQLLTFAFNDPTTHELPKMPDRRYVVAPNPTIAEGIVLREAMPADASDPDKQNYVTHRALIEVVNGGRPVAESPTFRGSIVATMFANNFDGMGDAVEPRIFPLELVLPSLPTGKVCTIEIRCMISVPIELQFDSVTCANGQPARLIKALVIQFHPRG